MSLDFGREICGDLDISAQREWLVTNGLGGYASGTVAGLLTRRYHGLLIAALKPPVARTLLVAKLDDTVTYQGQGHPLFANRWLDGRVEPCGIYHMERFRLEGTTPVWTYALGSARLEKRIWMEHGANTTYVRYDLQGGTESIRLDIEVLTGHRDHHGNTQFADMPSPPEALRVTNGLRLKAFESATPVYLLSSGAILTPLAEWYEGFLLSVERYRGLDDKEDLLHAADLHANLSPGESLTVVMSTHSDASLDGVERYDVHRERERRLVMQSGYSDEPEAIQHLVLAADQFVVTRPLPGERAGKSVIAGYPWFADWGRDTMISLPGLTLATGRPDVAAGILRTFAHYVDQGMLPNRFPDAGESPEYNTVDATLWYLEAIHAYYKDTKDESLIRLLYPVLVDIVECHLRGTRYQIGMDPADGLLHAGEPGVQLTWMDAKVDDWVVTPRIGKPVEINALWYNALCVMADLALLLGDDPTPYSTLSEQVMDSFDRFWYEPGYHCYDVLDGPQGNDPALRPNQLLAVSLPHSPLSLDRQRAVVDACADNLLTSHGLRSLSPDEPEYIGQYGGDRRTRDAAYHQGTVWGWLIGPFIRAHLRVYQDSSLALAYFSPLLLQLSSHSIGSISEAFDGNAPFTPRGCFAQAWSVAELLAVWQTMGRS